jgi:hypothetical protein
VLEVTLWKKDLGAIVAEDFKVSRQYSVAAKKGSRVLAMIPRKFSS